MVLLEHKLKQQHKRVYMRTSQKHLSPQVNLCSEDLTSFSGDLSYSHKIKL